MPPLALDELSAEAEDVASDDDALSPEPDSSLLDAEGGGPVEPPLP